MLEGKQECRKLHQRVGKQKDFDMENLSFTRKEMVAVMKVTSIMAAADGTLHDEEAKMMTMEALRFNLTEEDVKKMIAQSNEMDAKEALAAIATMTDSQKRYVTAYLGTMMAIDGNIDDKEMALWRMISTICKLPTMKITDAIQYMSN